MGGGCLCGWVCVCVLVCVCLCVIVCVVVCGCVCVGVVVCFCDKLLGRPGSHGVFVTDEPIPAHYPGVLQSLRELSDE